MEKLFTINYSLFTNKDEFRYLTNQYLFAELNYHPEYIKLGGKDDENYADFYSSYSESNMMSILQVQDNIDTGAMLNAGLINSEIAANNDIEKTRVLVNDIYLRALLDTNYEDGYTKEDIAYLLKYSTLNANINGDGIYSSWVMLGIDPVNIRNRSKQIPSTNDSTKKENNFAVYPNPAEDYIIIAYSGDIADLNKCELEVFDIYGSTIETINIENTTQYINISNLSKGVYLYRIINTGKIQYFNKFIKM